MLGEVHLQLSPVNLAPKFFSPPWGVHVHPVHPLSTPMSGFKCVYQAAFTDATLLYGDLQPHKI